MNITQSTPAQMDRLRKAFRLVNKFMVFMWKLGLGRLINIWPAGIGRIVVIRHVGRKSGKERLAPVNCAVVEGEIYCTAGFGPGSDWYRNIMAGPQVQLWLPSGRIRARARDVSDSPQRGFLLRQVIIASGFAAPLFGLNPKKLSDEAFLAATSTYRLIHFERAA
jgi:deazaflavin-dependent oxidoreductase (nitroreductase family)